MDAKTANKIEMARRLSNFHGLGFRAHNPNELIEHCARNSSPSFAHASAKRTRRTHVLFCNGSHEWHSLIGNLEG
jgi:hypothetical protein